MVIPIINEGERILLQLRKINLINPKVDIIIADGGSTDGTLENILKEEIQISAFLVKDDIGKLSAQLRMAFDYCIQEEYENVITMDGNNKDGEHGIEIIQNALLRGFDFVQGSRFIRGGQAINTPLRRLFAIRFIHAPITSIGAGFWYTDTTNGFRGHSAKLLNSSKMGVFRDIFDTYELIAYIPIQARKLNFRVTEVPVKRMYPLGGAIPTKIHGIRANLRVLKILFLAVIGGYSPKRDNRND